MTSRSTCSLHLTQENEVAGSQDQRLPKVGSSLQLSGANGALQTHLGVFRRCPGLAQAFEVSMEGQKGAALQAQEPLCTWLKLAHT